MTSSRLPSRVDPEEPVAEPLDGAENPSRASASLIDLRYVGAQRTHQRQRASIEPAETNRASSSELLRFHSHER
jgi:hypothetical protein